MKISNEEILCMNALTSLSGVNPKDCIIDDDAISFVVNEKDVGRAIGKNAETIKNLRQKMKKNVEIFGYFDDVKKFVSNVFYNVKIEKMEVKGPDDKKEVLIFVDFENRRKILSNGKRFRRIREIAKRNYKVDGIRLK